MPALFRPASCRPALALVCAAGIAGAAHAQVTLRTAALSGGPVPGIEASFLTFETPAAASGGRVAFPGRVVGGGTTAQNDTGMWFGAPGSLELWLRAGDIAPGTPGLPFDRIDGNDLPVVGDAPGLAVGGFAGAPGNSRFGVWRYDGPRSASVVALTGNAAPVPGVTGAQFDNFTSPLMASDGRVFFYSNLREGPGGIVFDNKGTLWAGGPPGPGAVVARWDQPAPGTTGVFLRFTSAYWSTNALGQVAVRATLRTGVGGVTSNDDEGIWRGGAGSFALVAREGENAPGAPGAVFGSFDQSPALNNRGDVLIAARLRQGVGGVNSSNDQVLYLATSGGLTLVAREGSAAPGVPGAFVGAFNTNFQAVNDAGTVLFVAGLLEDGVNVTPENDRVLLRGVPGGAPGGAWEVVAREGDDLGGTVGVLRGDFNAVHFSRSGVASFVMPYDNGVETGGALFLSAPGGAPRVVAQANRPFEIPGAGQTRTAQFFRVVAFPSSGGSDGRRTALANDGTLAFGLIFTDGSEGVFTAALTPPCRADLNEDGELTFDDIQLFVSLYNASDARADFNSDGEWTFDDIQLFVQLYNVGC